LDFEQQQRCRKVLSMLRKSMLHEQQVFDAKCRRDETLMTQMFGVFKYLNHS